MWPWLVAILCLGAAVFALVWAFALQSDKPDTEALPTVVGFDRDAAERELADKGFEETAVFYRSSGKADGVVLAQTPEPGAELEKGSSVALTISTGRPEVSVPQVTGLTSTGAQRLLDAKSLVAVERVVPSDRRAGLVLAQNPEPGTRVAKGARIFYEISKGPTFVAVPGVRGLRQQRAVRRLAGVGLKPVVRPVPSAERVGLVIAQNPPREQQVKPGTIVRINVSRGLGLVVVPALRGLQRPQAIAKVRAAGLVPVIVVVPSDRPKGRVLAQEPPREKRVKPGTKVRINVSSGAPPTTPPGA